MAASEGRDLEQLVGNALRNLESLLRESLALQRSMIDVLKYNDMQHKLEKSGHLEKGDLRLQISDGWIQVWYQNPDKGDLLIAELKSRPGIAFDITETNARLGPVED
jgi:uncharacterized protein YigA (DUF484 family)